MHHEQSSRGHGLLDEEFEQWYEININQSQARLRSNANKEYLWKRAIPMRDGDRIDTRQRIVLVLSIWNDYQESFWSEIPTLILSLSLGVTQIITTRQDLPSIQGSENTVDFGQIVQLFLLSLPILATVEVYYESHSGEALVNVLSPWSMTDNM
jgi:hypothetical protein